MDSAGYPLEAEDDLGSHFFPLQLASGEQGHSVLDLESVDPRIHGDDAHPDVVTEVELVAAHVAPEDVQDGVDSLTFRIDVGQNRMSVKGREPLYWTVAAAAATLLDTSEKSKAETDTDPYHVGRALNNQRIELPQGLGTFRFEVMAHKSEETWRSLFRLGADPKLGRWAGALGFPSIIHEGVVLVDRFLNQLLPAGRPLITSKRLTVAFSARARELFCMDVPGIVKLGVMNPGYVLLVRARDVDVVLDDPPVFLGMEGRLIPRRVLEQGLTRERWADRTYADITYAVLAVRAKPVELTPAF